MDADLSKRLDDLNPDQRRRFYECFSHDLTIAIRYVWSDTMGDAEKLEQIKFLNEILHRTIFQISGFYKYNWGGSDFVRFVGDYIAINPSIGGHIHSAIERSLAQAHRTNNPQSEIRNLDSTLSSINIPTLG
jgi:hypothetical protein